MPNTTEKTSGKGGPLPPPPRGAVTCVVTPPMPSSKVPSPSAASSARSTSAAASCDSGRCASSVSEARSAGAPVSAEGEGEVEGVSEALQPLHAPLVEGVGVPVGEARLLGVSEG